MRKAASLLVALALTASACGGQGSASPENVGASTTLRLGYFPNVTHATAIAGLEEGFFQDGLGDDVTLKTSTFNSGTDAIEAVFSDALDATFIGPNPAINAWLQSQGEAIRIVSGATSGGAFLVVRDGIDSTADLKGTTLSTPSLGNTQDVALRAWLKDQGLSADLEGGGDVSITPQDNALILETFRSGETDGAWVPEPWATRMIQEGKGTVLVDERDLWTDGAYVTTHLVVAATFLEEHPDVVKGLLEGLVAADDFVNEDPEQAKTVVGDAIADLTGAEIPAGTMDRAWDNLVFTLDPIASSLYKAAEDAVDVGLLDPVDLDGIYALDLLNEVLKEAGREQVTQ